MKTRQFNYNDPNYGETITVNVIILATGAYAAIHTDKRSLDVKLSPGMGPVKSLHQAAQENREKAARLLAQADLMRQAAKIL